MSDEFTSQVGFPPDGEPAPEQVEAAAEAEFTLEDLFNEQVNEDEVKKGLQDIALPNGSYSTVIPFNPKRIVDKAHPTRKIVYFWGGIELADVKGKIGFRLSPERFNKLDRDTGVDTGKPDMSYKLYLMAVKAYKVAYNANPSSFGDVLAYLRDYSTKLRVIQTGDGENMVVSINAVRPEA